MRVTALCMAVLLWPGSQLHAQDARRGAATAEFTERYGVIVDRNMFLRERRRAAQPALAPPQETVERPPAPPPPPEAQYVLVGVVLEDEGVRAYFEQAGSTIVRIAPGDALARGHITEIQLDGVTYTLEDEATWIEFGHDLTGAPAARIGSIASPAATPGTAPGATPGANGEAAPPADTSNLSPEERMRLRRQQELNR